MSRMHLHHFEGEELAPGAKVQSDEEILILYRNLIESAYHPSCTCKMGTHDMAVTDAELKMYMGLKDYALWMHPPFQTITNGNIHAPVLMLAEKAADIIAGNTPLAPMNVPY